MDRFLVARNPEIDSRLPYLVRLPLDGGLVLKVKDTWPRACRIYCHLAEGFWDPGLELLDEAQVLICRRRGAAIDLVLDRPQLARSQFIFTEALGHPAIFWQTQKVARTANPGARVPKGRTVDGIQITVDTREKYGSKFTGRKVEIRREALAAGDYAVEGSSGLLAAVVVEGNYPDLFRLHASRGASMLARLAIRYTEVPVIFAGSRKFAEEWRHRFLTSAAEDDLTSAAGGEAVSATDFVQPARRRRGDELT
ncbi:hypothetical protein BH23ACT12_BH23ACT12_17420 [soil metagenome]